MSIKLQTKTFRFGANYDFVGKTGEDYLSHSRAYTVKPANFKMLADHIGRGYPWMPSLLDSGSRRWQYCANYADLLALDIDNGMTIQEALEHPYAQYLGLGIESSSSTPEHNKFRLVFRLPTPITPESGGWHAIKACLTFLAQEFDNLSDPQCKDASRYYFGAKGRKPFHLSETATLPVEFFDAVTKNEIRLDQERKARQAEAARQLEAFLKSRGDGATMADVIGSVQEALRWIPPRQSGTGSSRNYDECLRVLMALHASFDEQIAIRLAEEWSPSCKKDKWDIPYKMGTFSHSAVHLGTIFYYAKQHREEGYKPHRKPLHPQKRAA